MTTKACGAKSDDNYEDGGFEAPKATTVTRMATLRGLIPVTVGTVEAYHGGVGADTIRGGGPANAARRTIHEVTSLGFRPQVLGLGVQSHLLVLRYPPDTWHRGQWPTAILVLSLSLSLSL